MKTNPSSRFQAIWAGIVLLCLSAAPLCADTFGDFTYTDDGTSITITDYPTTNTGDVVIPDTIIGKPVTSIGNVAFANCSALTSVTISSSVTSIGDLAFSNCSALTSVTISSSVTSIGQFAFYSCSALTVAVFLGDAPSLGSLVFSGTAAGFAIHYRRGSTGFTTPTWEGYPALPFDGEMVFGLFTYRVVGGTTIEITDYPEGAVGPAEIPAMIDGKSVTSIGDYAFLNCSSLTSVTIPEGVTSIGQFAFFNCSALTSVTIPEGVTSIGDYAFYSCSALTVAVFLGDAPSLGSLVFSGTAAGFAIHYRRGSTGFTTPTWEGYPALPFDGEMVFGLFTYRVVGGTTIEITDYPEGAVGPAEIPAMIDGKSVTSIGDYAFLNCSSLTSVTIPEGVTSIGQFAFFNCSALTSVTIPEGVTSIGDYAFYSCSALTVAVFLGDAPSLGSLVFSGTAAGFAIHYRRGSTSFTNPTWEGYPAYPITEPSGAATPSLEINSVGELLVELEFASEGGDLEVQSSPDAVVWTDLNFFVPAGRTVTFPFPKPFPTLEDKAGFFRLIEAPSKPLEATVPNLAGMTLGVLGESMAEIAYEFQPDGTGLVGYIFRPSFYDFAWTVLEAQPGLVTVRVESADGFVEVLNLQYLDSGGIAAFTTYSEGPGGLAWSFPQMFQAVTALPEVAGAPASIDATSWQFVRMDPPNLTVAFSAGGVATGPNLATGAPTTWTYNYIPTGSNTATIAVTDADGNFGRFFLIFEQSGNMASFSFSSGSVDLPFGDGNRGGDFVRQ